MNDKTLKTSVEDWCINQSINRPFITIIISLLITFVVASGIQFIVMDDDMMKMLPNDIDSKITWDAVQKEFGSTEIIFIAFGHKGKTAYTSQTISDLWALTEHFSKSKYIDEIINISTAIKIDHIDGFMEIDDLQSIKNLPDQEVEDIKAYLSKNSNLKKQLISRGEDYLLSIVRPYDGVGLDVFRNEVVSVSDSILTGYDIHYGGTAYVTGSVPKLIRDDVGALIKMGMIIMLIILLINLRSLKAVLLVVMVIVFSLIAMMGFMGWVYRLTGSDKFLFALLNTSMPIILLTIANSDGVHVITKFFRELRDLGEVHLAVESAMRSLLTPIFLTSITTIAAFLTMITSPLDPLIGYGVCISIGILWAWLLSSFMLPAVIGLLYWDQQSQAISTPSFLEKFIENTSRIIISYPRYVFSFGLAMILVGVFGLNKINIDVNVASFFKPGTEIRDSMDFMDTEMSGTMDLRILVDGDIKDPSILKKIDSLQTFIRGVSHINVAYSIVDVVKQMHRAVMDDDAKFETIPDDRQKINNLFTMYSISGSHDDFSSMVDHDYTSALITSLASVMTTEEVFSFVDSISVFIKNYFQDLIKVDVTGMIVVIRDMVNMVIQSSLLSIIISVILIGCITALFFQRFFWGLLAILPLSGAVILNFGLMGHFNITLNHITAILSAIIIGVGVDFAIHFISQFQRLSFTLNRNAISSHVIKDVGYPIILDASSNMAFGALLFSAFIPVQYIGGLMVFAMLSTSLGTLILLASVTELLKGYIIK